MPRRTRSGAPRNDRLSMDKSYFVYIATNHKNTVLYTGVTNNLIRRIYEHRQKLGSKFTTRYSVTKLVYYEIFNDIEEAIKREKQIKAGSRQKKIDLILKDNPKFEDLYSQIV